MGIMALLNWKIDRYSSLRFKLPERYIDYISRTNKRDMMDVYASPIYARF